MKKQRKRMRRGVDWHAWAFRTDNSENWPDGTLFHWAEVEKPKHKPTPGGKWVRVRFVEVRKP